MSARGVRCGTAGPPSAKVTSGFLGSLHASPWTCIQRRLLLSGTGFSAVYRCDADDATFLEYVNSVQSQQLAEQAPQQQGQAEAAMADPKSVHSPLTAQTFERLIDAFEMVSARAGMIEVSLSGRLFPVNHLILHAGSEVTPYLHLREMRPCCRASRCVLLLHCASGARGRQIKLWAWLFTTIGPVRGMPGVNNPW